MPSLFGRSKASSSSLVQQNYSDEFGTLGSSNNNNVGNGSASAYRPHSSRDKDQYSSPKRTLLGPSFASLADLRSLGGGGGGGGGTISGGGEAGTSSSSSGPNIGGAAGVGYASLLPEGAFFPTFIPLKAPPPPPPPSAAGVVGAVEYGYIAADWDIYLSLEDVERLLDVVDHELSTRGKYFYDDVSAPVAATVLSLDLPIPSFRSSGTSSVLHKSLGHSCRPRSPTC